MKQEIHAETAQAAFLISLETDIQLFEKEKICGRVLTGSKGYSVNYYLLEII